MNKYKCILAFTSKLGKAFKYGQKIEYRDYSNLTYIEKQYFIGYEDEDDNSSSWNKKQDYPPSTMFFTTSDDSPRYGNSEPVSTSDNSSNDFGGGDFGSGGAGGDF
jgi:hypothetical protein